MENVKVTDHGSFHETLALSWEHGGARYHIWESSPDVLYKNPPIELKHNDPGFFHARKLDPGSKVNQKMILEARAFARQNGLYEKAAIDKAEKKYAEEMAQLGAVALQRKKEAGPEMYEALRACIEGKVIESQHAVHSSGKFCTVCGVNRSDAVHHSKCPINLAESALAKAVPHE